MSVRVGRLVTLCFRLMAGYHQVELVVQQLSLPLLVYVLFPLICPNAALHNRLQLTGVAESILYHHLAHLLVLVAVLTLGGVGEVDVAIADDPVAVVGKGDDVALRVEEEQRLCRADGEAGVCALAAGGDFGADLVLKDLVPG